MQPKLIDNKMAESLAHGMVLASRHPTATSKTPQQLMPSHPSNYPRRTAQSMSLVNKQQSRAAEGSQTLQSLDLPTPARRSSLLVEEVQLWALSKLSVRMDSRAQ